MPPSPPSVGTDRDQAIPRLVRERGPQIRALALRVLGNAADADDAVQETFLQAFRRWETFQGRADPGTWLYTIAVRVCRKRLTRRRSVGARTVRMSDVTPFTDTAVADLRRRGDGPAARAEAAEAARAVRDAVARLPAHFRVALTLKDMLELPVAEVSAILGVKPDTVKTRVHRGRLLLRKALLAASPRLPAPAPTYERRLCLDLLRAKLDAMDKGRDAPLKREVLCERCRAVFAELDQTQRICASLAQGEMPAALTRAALDALDDERRADGDAPEPRARRRPPRKEAAPRRPRPKAAR